MKDEGVDYVPHHEPVLRERVFALLAPALTQPEPILVDATVGLGGHALFALEHVPGLRLIGIDRDDRALAISRDRLSAFSDRVTLVHAVYDRIGEVLQELGHPHVNGILFDLGVSSMQLDDPSRGFAYARDVTLDMRMDPGGPVTAADILNSYSEQELARILRTYGEERFATRIARRIVSERAHEPFTTSGRLVDIVRDSIPAPARRQGGNPAKRTFQALRIEVNDELTILERALPQALDCLALGGRIVVMSYQSLEDSIVKGILNEATRVRVPEDLPFIPEGAEPAFTLLTRGAQTASPDEVVENPRAASVRIRGVERVRWAA
jgi:16S rRNA (cytosine1402-N4)-methyltransferase